MHRIPVADIMKTTVITIDPQELVVDAAELMDEYKIRRLPVVDVEGCLVGIVSDADVLEAETAGSVLSSYEPNADAEWLTVADIMSRDVVSIEPGSAVGELATILMKHKVSGLPVVEPDERSPHRAKLVGIVTEMDIFKLLADAWNDDGVR